MRVACIDIGTNAVLLLVAKIDKNGGIYPLHFEQRLPRIGRGVAENKIVQEAAINQLTEIIKEYKRIALRYDPSSLIACGTSALREAKNKTDIIKQVKSATGINLEIISSSAEGLYTYRGAVSGFPHLQQQAAVIDIGGGTTEIIFPKPGIIHNQPTIANSNLNSNCLELGAVRITERYFKSNPPTHYEIENATKFIAENFKGIFRDKLTKYALIGVAGTVTTLACLDQKLVDFDVSKVSGYQLTRLKINRLTKKLSSLTNEEIRLLSETAEGRSDILYAGALILQQFMNKFGFNKITVSERGLRYGLIFREWKK